jgi:hypothetical protein
MALQRAIRAGRVLEALEILEKLESAAQRDDGTAEDASIKELWEPPNLEDDPDGSKELTGELPLHLAAFCGCEELVDVLLRRGYSVKERAPLSEATPLQCAKTYSIMLRLLQAEADPSTGLSYAPLFGKDKHGLTAFDRAVQFGNLTLVRQLAMTGRGSVNGKSIMRALVFDKGDVASWMLLFHLGISDECDIFQHAGDMQRMLSYELRSSVEKGRYSTVRFLVRAGVPVTARDMTPPLRHAYWGRHFDMIQILMTGKRGADWFSDLRDFLKACVEFKNDAAFDYGMMTAEACYMIRNGKAQMQEVFCAAVRFDCVSAVRKLLQYDRKRALSIEDALFKEPNPCGEAWDLLVEQLGAASLQLVRDKVLLHYTVERFLSIGGVLLPTTTAAELPAKACLWEDLQLLLASVVRPEEIATWLCRHDRADWLSHLPAIDLPAPALCQIQTFSRLHVRFDANALDDNGESLLIREIRSGRYDNVVHLLRHGANANSAAEPLRAAFYLNYFAIAEALIRAGARVRPDSLGQIRLRQCECVLLARHDALHPFNRNNRLHAVPVNVIDQIDCLHVPEKMAMTIWRFVKNPYSLPDRSGRYQRVPVSALERSSAAALQIVAEMSRRRRWPLLVYDRHKYLPRCMERVLYRQGVFIALSEAAPLRLTLPPWSVQRLLILGQVCSDSPLSLIPPEIMHSVIVRYLYYPWPSHDHLDWGL